MKHRSYQSILIIRMSSLGDIILTSPLIRSLRKAYPDARLDYVVKNEFYPLICHNPHLDNIFVYDKRENNLKAIKTKIKSVKYDLILDIHKKFRSHYLVFGSKAKEIRRFKKHIFERQLLVWFGVSKFTEVIPQYKKYFHGLHDLNVSYDGVGTEIFITEEIINRSKDILKSAGIQPNDKCLAICPGAKYWNKRWLPERFAELAGKIKTELNHKLIFLGGPNEMGLNQKILSVGHLDGINLAGKTNLLESAAILEYCDLAITNDSGLMHMAQAVKTPVVAIFGPTTKELGYFPLPESSKVVEDKSVECRPCTHHGMNHCPKKHFNCMKNITVDTVYKACRELLA